MIFTWLLLLFISSYSPITSLMSSVGYLSLVLFIGSCAKAVCCTYLLNLFISLIWYCAVICLDIFLWILIQLTNKVTGASFSIVSVTGRLYVGPNRSTVTSQKGKPLYYKCGPKMSIIKRFNYTIILCATVNTIAPGYIFQLK